jgi:hypothetical protein
MLGAQPDALGPVRTDTSWWRERAACRGVSLDEFYGAGAQHGGGLTWCRRCPVSQPCLWQGIAEEVEAGYAYGIRGGMSAPQRTALAQDLTPEVIAQHLAEALAGRDSSSTRAVA